MHENISFGLNARNVLDTRSREIWGGNQIGSHFFATLIVNIKDYFLEEKEHLIVFLFFY
ncbi:MAG: hypothetical protein H7329_11100 [Opitutaceae bacterium]|nr:hypothetical protein [Cytophagales bacterium]